MKKILIFLIIALNFNIAVFAAAKSLLSTPIPTPIQIVEPSPAGSQTQTSLGIDPAILEIVLSAETTIKQITITNNSNLPQPIKTLKQSFTPRERLDLTPDELKIFDSSSWITLEDKDTDFILQPHESKKITITITQPKNASPGGHYATIIFQPLIPEELVSQESIFVYARVAVLVFLQVKGDIVQNLEITKANYSVLSEPGSHSFDFTVKNTGNTHIQPSGKLNIYDSITNQLIASEPMPSSIILPKTEKPIHFDVDLNNPIGKYSAELVLNYGSESVVLKSGRNDFYIFPITIVFIGFLPASLLIIFVFKNRGRFVLAYKTLFNVKQKNWKKKGKKDITFKLSSKVGE